MASLNAVREGLKTALDAIADPFTVYAEVPGSIAVPAAVISPGADGEPAIRFDSTMARGSDDFIFTVTVLVSMADDRSGQEELDAYLEGSGGRSVKAAVEADPSLGGVAHFAHVREARNYGPMTYNDTRYVGVDFIIEVTA
jgi:hypothetical protein